VIDVGVVDGANGCIGIGIGSQQRSLGVRGKARWPSPETLRRHAGHPLVNEEECHRFVAQF
jgi:hypothetical protein